MSQLGCRRFGIGLCVLPGVGIVEGFCFCRCCSDCERSKSLTVSISV